MAATTDGAAAAHDNDTSKEPPSTAGTKPDGEGKKAVPRKLDTAPAKMAVEAPDLDDFGLPIRKYPPPGAESQFTAPTDQDDEKPAGRRRWSFRRRSTSRSAKGQNGTHSRASSGGSRRQSLRGDSDADEFEDAVSKPVSETASVHNDTIPEEPRTPMAPNMNTSGSPEAKRGEIALDMIKGNSQTKNGVNSAVGDATSSPITKKDLAKQHARDTSIASTVGTNGMSEFSHQVLITEKEEKKEEEDETWQTMPAYAPYDIYDDDNKLVAKEHVESEDEKYGYAGLGGAGKGYTRVTVDDDAESATSMDDNTKYLFNKSMATTSLMEDEEVEQRDAVSQLQATKDLLTEGQRIAYVGIARLELAAMNKEAETTRSGKKIRKEVRLAAESMKMWSQKMMIRLYTHMEISSAEQVMIEQLSEHGVQPKDLTPVLMANARVKNPMAEASSSSTSLVTDKSPRHSISSTMIQGDKSPRQSISSPRIQDENSPRPSPHPSISSPRLYDEHSPRPSVSSPNLVDQKSPSLRVPSPQPVDEKSSSLERSSPKPQEEEAAQPPPPYETHQGDELDAQTPSQLPTTAKIDIDLRWTVLCDLFLVLIADSIYDSRSRVLLEKVGNSLDVPWIDICRFEKKVTEALEMQQNAEKENWNEDEHMENRRKLALRRRYVYMGLATVGGGLVIGLSAGLLAPMIGAGLAAGFTTIGVSGTTSFLAGAGGAAVITSSAAASGSIIGVRAANRRTGAVKTFEYRPLHNNKRVNLIVTISGWMTGKVDDVRLPYSTVDPLMGDIYSVLWEPEMLTSMGDTINILATEALTQGLQQVLGSTILISLMAALQLPVVLSKLSYLIDNPWAVSLDRATSAGLILADSLLERNLGTRPITLVGYSLGSRVIFSCLQELARKGAFGIVQNVYMFGSPVVVKQEDFIRARTVVSGRFINGYNRNDWILGYLFRLTNGGIRRIAGLAAVDGVQGLENMDLTEDVNGHMQYRTAMPRLLRKCGWSVESDEFNEIEDPDPENHNARQRELINEIEEARKELEKEGKPKGAFSFFSRRKKVDKKEWEIYEDTAGGKAIGKTEDKDGNNHGVLFDVEAMRAELAKEDVEIEVKELKSTLPPMKLDLTPTPSPGVSPRLPHTPLPRSPRNSFQQTKSADATSGLRTSHEHRTSREYGLSGERTPTTKQSREYLPEPVVHHVDAEDGMSMTFDTSFEGSPAPKARDSPAPPPKDAGEAPTARAEAASRPDVKTSRTVPNIMLTNAWADEEEPDFGKEKEISMTFA